MTLTIFLFTSILIVLIFIIITTWQVFRYTIKFSFSKRALLKQYVYEKIPPEAQKSVLQWLILISVLWILLSILVMNLTWKTDFSFIFILFPIVSYFMITRFVVWDKKDILSEYNKKIKK